MFAYQLQLPSSLRPKDLMEEIATKSWDIVSHRLDWNPNEHQVRSKFQEEVHHAFSLYLKAFDLCGTSEICADEMRTLIPGLDQVLDAKIYHLHLPMRMDLFLDFLATLLLNNAPGMNHITMQKAHDDLKFVIRSILKRYLSTNPWCGKAQICQHSKQVDI